MGEACTSRPARRPRRKPRTSDFFGDDIPAADVLRAQWGLVNRRVVPRSDLRVSRRWELGGSARIRTDEGASGWAKWMINRSLESDRRTAFDEEAWAQELTVGTADAGEGMWSFARAAQALNSRVSKVATSGVALHALSHPVCSFQGMSKSPTAVGDLLAAVDHPTAQDLAAASSVFERFAVSFEPGLYSGEDAESLVRLLSKTRNSITSTLMLAARRWNRPTPTNEKVTRKPAPSWPPSPGNRSDRRLRCSRRPDR